jgi:hypothetical protein
MRTAPIPTGVNPDPARVLGLSVILLLILLAFRVADFQWMI